MVCPDRITFAYLVLVRDINTQTSIQCVEYYSLLTSPKGYFLSFSFQVESVIGSRWPRVQMLIDIIAFLYIRCQPQKPSFYIIILLLLPVFGRITDENICVCCSATSWRHSEMKSMSPRGKCTESSFVVIRNGTRAIWLFPSSVAID